MAYAYLRDPASIYRQSFEIIRREADLARFPPDILPLALRLVHAVGDTSILGDLIWSQEAMAAGMAALVGGAALLVDATMVAAGIIRKRLPAGNEIICSLHDAAVPGIAASEGTTRSAAAVALWRPHLAGSVVAIGNAPTALFRLLELIDEGAPRPALILGFPVGFVGALESKAALACHPAGVPFVALAGRRGGSAMAAAAVNALCGEPES